MREVIAGFCGEYQYPPQAAQTLLAVYGRIEEIPAARQLFGRAGEEYSRNPDMDYTQYLHGLKVVCEEEGLPWETASLLFFICLTPRLGRYYEDRGLPAAVCRASLEDLKWKLWECYRVYGVWGSFVPDWFPGFFMLNRFTLGRLQFEMMPFPAAYERAGREKPAGIQKALFVHIPSSGPLLHEDCIRSYRLAADFFRRFFPDNFPGKMPPRGEARASFGIPIAFGCISWLLFPEHRAFLPKNSRILEFMDDFDVYDSWPDPGGGDLWRIFGKPDCSDTEGLPENTSLQRAYKAWMLAGGTPGIGRGMLLWNEEH